MTKQSGYILDIAAYYRHSSWLYKYLWYSPRSLGLHYGFWEQDTKTHDEALNNQFLQIVQKGKIRKGMRVLDAGCGVGGGAIYVAQQTGAEVTGVTITPEQVQEAVVNAQAVNVDHLAHFLLADYTKMPFENNSFDVVFAVESACYAFPKRLFLDEAYRVLKPGGVLVISDGYAIRKAKDRVERTHLLQFCTGWRLKELIQFGKMTQAIQKAGFKDIELVDKTQAVGPSLARMRWLILLATPLLWFARYLHFSWLYAVRDNVQSMRASIEGVKLGLMGYYMHVAKK
jgi:tocopherol O-methyltransferase